MPGAEWPRFCKRKKSVAREWKYRYCKQQTRVLAVIALDLEGRDSRLLKSAVCFMIDPRAQGFEAESADPKSEFRVMGSL